LRAVIDDDVRAFACEACCGCVADACGAAGDERELEIHLREA
jgi:hypothetical protein